jgi:hypothetical protein
MVGIPSTGSEDVWTEIEIMQNSGGIALRLSSMDQRTRRPLTAQLHPLVIVEG